MAVNIEIKELVGTTDVPYDLLLLADPSRVNIDKYLSQSVIYKAEVNCQTIGCYVLCRVDNESTEIKNIVVAEQYQGKGIGARLLSHALETSKANGIKKVIIGTGNSSTGQLYLYQKLGFLVTEIKRDFFIENYVAPIFENGIRCTDMIVLTKHL